MSSISNIPDSSVQHKSVERLRAGTIITKRLRVLQPSYPIKVLMGDVDITGTPAALTAYNIGTLPRGSVVLAVTAKQLVTVPAAAGSDVQIKVCLGANATDAATTDEILDESATSAWSAVIATTGSFLNGVFQSGHSAAPGNGVLWGINNDTASTNYGQQFVNVIARRTTDDVVGKLRVKVLYLDADSDDGVEKLLQ